MALLLEKLAACGFFFAVGPAIIFLNKHLLDRNGIHFKHPYLLALLGVFASSLVSQLLVATGYVTLPNASKMTRRVYITHILPIGLMMASTLNFGNLAFQYLSVSFIQILKVLHSSPREEVL
jgi:hypothetical protein